MFYGHIQRQKQHRNDMKYQAWYTAKLERVKEIPDLQELLEPEEKAQEMTEGETLNFFKALTASFGGTIKEV